MRINIPSINYIALARARASAAFLTRATHTARGELQRHDRRAYTERRGKAIILGSRANHHVKTGFRVTADLCTAVAATSRSFGEKVRI